MSYPRSTPMSNSSNNLLIKYTTFTIPFYFLIVSLIIVIVFKLIKELINICNCKLREETIISETEEIYNTEEIDDVEESSIKPIVINDQNNSKEDSEDDLPSYSEVYSNC